MEMIPPIPLPPRPPDRPMEPPFAITEYFRKRRARKILKSFGICPTHGIQRKPYSPASKLPGYAPCPACNEEKQKEYRQEIEWACGVLGITLTQVSR